MIKRFLACEACEVLNSRMSFNNKNFDNALLRVEFMQKINPLRCQCINNTQRPHLSPPLRDDRYFATGISTNDE